MSQRTKTIIISIVVCVVLAGVGVGLYCAWPAIVGTITGNAYYTYEDVQNAYDDGYTDGIRNESELTAQIDYYKAEVDKYIESLAEAQIKIENLEKDLQDAINSGNADKETIAGLQDDLAEAQADITAKQEQIEELQDDIKYYQELLEAYADSDKLRVTFTMVDNGKERNYDVQVVEPNGYLSEVITPDRADFEGWSLTKGGELIDDLTTVQVTDNMTIYGMCTNTVTFMVNGEEYATQEVSYGKYATDVEIEDTTYELFNGWKIYDELVLIETYNIYSDTIFNADITYKYDVKFIVDDEEYNSQIVTENSFAVLPDEPIKTGYDFKGWSLDGLNIINVTDIKITTNINYIAVFTINYTGSYKLSYKYYDNAISGFVENCYFNINDDGKNITTEFVSSERKDSSKFSSDITIDLTVSKPNTVVYHIYFSGATWMETSVMIDTTIYINFDREQETYSFNYVDDYHSNLFIYLEKV